MKKEDKNLLNQQNKEEDLENKIDIKPIKEII